MRPRKLQNGKQEPEAIEDRAPDEMDTDDNNGGRRTKAIPPHISSALKRQRKDLSDAVAFARAVKDAVTRKMALLATPVILLPRPHLAPSAASDRPGRKASGDAVNLEHVQRTWQATNGSRLNCLGGKLTSVVTCPR